MGTVTAALGAATLARPVHPQLLKQSGSLKGAEKIRFSAVSVSRRWQLEQI